MSLFGKKPPAKPSPPKRSEAETKAAAARLAQQFGQQAAKKAAPTKEDKIREMIEQDPEKAAALLREMFLKK